MLGITRKDNRTNEWVRHQTGVQHIFVRINQLKWAEHVARLSGD
jgi:hypothetical protein